MYFEFGIERVYSFYPIAADFLFLTDGSFLPAATNLCSYNTVTLACRLAWQCCINRGLSLGGRNKSMYFDVDSEKVKLEISNSLPDLLLFCGVIQTSICISFF